MNNVLPDLGANLHAAWMTNQFAVRARSRIDVSFSFAFFPTLLPSCKNLLNLYRLGLRAARIRILRQLGRERSTFFSFSVLLSSSLFFVRFHWLIFNAATPWYRHREPVLEVSATPERNGTDRGRNCGPFASCATLIYESSNFNLYWTRRYRSWDFDRLEIKRFCFCERRQ